MLKSNDKQKSILGQHCLFLCKRVILGPRKSGSPPLGLAVWPTALISLHCHCIYNLTTEAKNIHNFYIAFLEQVEGKTSWQFIALRISASPYIAFLSHLSVYCASSPPL